MRAGTRPLVTKWFGFFIRYRLWPHRQEFLYKVVAQANAYNLILSRYAASMPTHISSLDLIALA